MSDLASPAGQTRTNQYGRYTVSLTVVRVPVPAERRAAWRSGIADLYERLDQMIDEDHQKKEQA